MIVQINKSLYFCQNNININQRQISQQIKEYEIFNSSITCRQFYIFIIKTPCYEIN